MDDAGKQYQRSYIPQELLAELNKVNNRLLIGIPCERHSFEKRLALTPEAVDLLTDAGHQVLVESGAGLGINYSDNHFSEAGAQIVGTAEEAYQADIILKILPPLPDEVAWMKPRSTVFSLIPFTLLPQETFEAMMHKRINAMAYDLMEDEHGRFPFLNLISEIEGTAVINIASSMLSTIQGGKGVLLGGVPGVAPTELIIVGAGAAGTIAARTALALGATVKLFDNDLEKLRMAQQMIGQKVFTSNFHPKVLQNAFRSADVVIGAMNYMKANRRYLVAEDLIRTMKKGALIIDLRISQGGCFETTCGLSPSDPEAFEQYGVLHYCKQSISNIVPRTASMAFSNVLVSLLTMLGDAGSVQGLIKEDECFRSGVYIYSGKPVNNYVSSRFNILSNNINIYLSAF